ncbi:MAG: hypothetical protein U0K54_02580 [Acutalibacteraceae bacterium]|nr:hypothetical protein [Acutalibacteraceae bacterium]
MKNKNRKIIITVCAFATLVFVITAIFAIKFINRTAKDVTMLQLLTSPEKYDGKLIRVIGIGNIEFEGNCISPSIDDFNHYTGNSIWIELDEEKTPYNEAWQHNGRYVIVEGIFDKDDCGHMGMFRGSIKNISRYELWDTYLTLHSTITAETSTTYSYKITDYTGKILDYQSNLPKPPEHQIVDIDVIGMSIQTGTGLSTNYAKYYDLENGLISEKFNHVLTAKDDYIVYANFKDGEYFIIVQDIFNKNQYYKEYKLENVSPVAPDFVIECCFNQEGNISITYLSGEDYTETNYTIVMLPKDKMK